MSKQDSQHIVDKQVTKAKSNFKKPKRQWELWQRIQRKYRKIWRKKHYNYWNLHGRYRDKESLQQALDKVSREFWNMYQYKIVGPGEDRPEPRK